MSVFNLSELLKAVGEDDSEKFIEKYILVIERQTSELVTYKT